MTPSARRNLALLCVTLVMLTLSLAFPRVLAFVEMGARQLRYYWWLVLMVAVGGWLIFFTGRNDR